MNPKTLTMLGALALLALAPAASAGNLASAHAVALDSVAETDSSATAARTNCDLIAFRSPSAVNADVNLVNFETNGRLFETSLNCGDLLIPGGCTLTFALSVAGSTLWYVFYVYNTPVSPANEVSGASTYAGMVGGAAGTWISCI